MRRRFLFRRAPMARQRGFGMIMVITLIAMMASYLIANGLSRTQAEVNNERDRRTLQAMQEAKAALIAYAASQGWTPTGSTDQPGALPCPSVDDAGTAGTGCTATASTRIGRFPWKTIGTSDIRDASGEILWYAISANFRKASGTTVINSDTQGTLTVTGSASASNAVAVIIAPGTALNGQDRSVNSISNYLESTNATGTDTFVTKVAPDTFNNLTDREVVFNDNIVVISQAELMAVVEPAVAARIEQYIKPYLQTYYSNWGAFPFPAVFSSGTYPYGPGTNAAPTLRAQSSYVGDTTQTSGLLPLNPSASYTWTSDSDPVSLTGGTADSITTESCSIPGGTTNWRCDFEISARNSIPICGVTNRYCIITPTFRVAARAGTNVGKSFADPPTANSVTVALRSGSDASCTSTLSTKTISGSVISSGRGTVNFDATLTYTGYKASDFRCRYRVTIPTVVASSLTGSSDADAGWFIRNEWYRQTYYAASQGFLPGGGSSCLAGSTCLTVNNLSSSYTTSNDKRAVLIFAGRALTSTSPAQSRTSASLNDYLEGTNQTPANSIFTNRTGTASSAVTLNDRAIVLSP